MEKVLIANRGEIAVRIINACHELGLRTVAIYSLADADSLHVSLADEAYCIGQDEADTSYLNVDNILSIARYTNCDAIHPGYGFLSESLKFLTSCEHIGIKFIGPSLENARLMSNKLKAKKAVEHLKVPVLPGIDEPIKSVSWLLDKMNQKDIKFPILLKSAMGGGGKGISLVKERGELADQYKLMTEEAKKSFNDKTLYMELPLKKFMHVEVQVLGDNAGNVIQLGERNCTLQRNMQKMLEETPAPKLPEEVRHAMQADAIKICKKIHYIGAGTIEYLYDFEKSNYYFMEMNTRIQVEHPISESISGIDIVKEQLLIAVGCPLSKMQNEIQLSGNAIECRILAEKAEQNWSPSIGTIKSLMWPYGLPGVRLDSYIYAGYKPKVFYDSLIG